MRLCPAGIRDVEPRALCIPTFMREADFLVRLKLESCLYCDHSWRVVAAQAYAQQSGGRRCGVADGSESSLRARPAGDAGDHRGQREVRVIEDVEELPLQAQGNVLG